MCGIAGFTYNNEVNDPSSMIRLMSDQIAHRGPDDSGYWINDKLGLSLGHRRLAIIDLSPQGHQPMISHSGRYVITFNGEIYNFKKLALELSGYPFRGHSDTEIMLAAFERWGVEAAVSKFTGMFAFGVVDLETETFYLYRDRIGEKPLYYGWINNQFVFSSELKALRAHPKFNNPVSKDATNLFFQLSYVPSPLSIYENIFKLPPASYLKLPLPLKHKTPLEPKFYWDPKEKLGRIQKTHLTPTEALRRLDKMLREKIANQMISDVPLGAFLSGGVDSAVVTALMSACSSKPINTFTIGFEHSQYNEANQAREIANHLRTNHTELKFDPKNAIDLIPKLAKIYDEPFADSSQLPTTVLSELTRKHVTVALSGDGGDEVFAGYNRYFWAPEIWSVLSHLPRFVKLGAASFLNGIPPETWDRILKLSGQKTPGEKIAKLSRALSAETEMSLYAHLISHSDLANSKLPFNSTWNLMPSFAEKMMFSDVTTYLPDDILTKVDRASMSVSLETRIPFLDHEILEFVWSLPLEMRMENRQGKKLLREIFLKYFPEKLLKSPKQGFAVPLDSWIRGPLKEWTIHTINNFQQQQEISAHLGLQSKLEEHLSGKRNWQYHLWDALIYQIWWENDSTKA